MGTALYGKPIRQRTKAIAFVSESASPLQIGKQLEMVASYAQERRTCNIRFVPKETLSQLGCFAECDGILADTFSHEVAESLRATGLPIVKLTVSDDPDVTWVDFSPEAEGKMAAEWFLRRQFANFAFCGMYGLLFCDRLREAFSATLKDAGFDCIQCDSEKMREPSSTASVVDVTTYLMSWLPTLPPRTAVLCLHDRRAELVVELCLRLGRSVPEDIAVMGRRNDIAICMGSPRTITSSEPNLRLQIYTALDLLMEMIDNPDAAKERRATLIPPLGVVERESTNVYPVDPPWLAKALSLVDENINRRVSLADIAAAAGVSQSALQTAIHKMFGTSVQHYVLSVKMREAKRLVDRGGCSVKELVARTGFSTQSYFTRAYTSYYGRPPSMDR